MPYKDIKKQRKFQREWTRRNRNIQDKNKRRYVQRNRKFAYEYCEENPCVDCGESDPIVLEFDHCKGIKTKAVSTMISSGHSLERIKKEIAKCEVRCANCHRRKTAERAGWMPWRFEN